MTEITQADRTPEITADLADRFWARVEKRGPFDCWPWRGNITIRGYGRFYITSQKTIRAHRLALILAKGPIADHLVADHICRNHECCNPAHLRALTNRENVLIGVGPTAQNARKTHCKRGHEFSGYNLLMNGKARQCRTCKNEVDGIRRKRIATAIRTLITEGEAR